MLTLVNIKHQLGFTKLMFGRGGRAEPRCGKHFRALKGTKGAAVAWYLRHQALDTRLVLRTRLSRPLFGQKSRLLAPFMGQKDARDGVFVFFHCFFSVFGQKTPSLVPFWVFWINIGPKKPDFLVKVVERRGFLAKRRQKMAPFWTSFFGADFCRALAATVFFTFLEKVMFF